MKKCCCSPMNVGHTQEGLQPETQCSHFLFQKTQVHAQIDTFLPRARPQAWTQAPGSSWEWAWVWPQCAWWWEGLLSSGPHDHWLSSWGSTSSTLYKGKPWNSSPESNLIENKKLNYHTCVSKLPHFLILIKVVRFPLIVWFWPISITLCNTISWRNTFSVVIPLSFVLDMWLLSFHGLTVFLNENHQRAGSL